MSDSTPERQRFIAELRYINEETAKFVAEQHKLMAEEAHRFDRDRWLAPWSWAISLTAAAALGALLAKLFGHA